MFLAKKFSNSIIINEAVGGLFDFNATLPLVGIQFVLLTVLLTFLLYKPVFFQRERRKEYAQVVLDVVSRSLSVGRTYRLQGFRSADKFLYDAQVKRIYFVSKSKEKMSNDLELAYQDAVSALQLAAQELKKDRIHFLNDLEDEIRTLTFSTLMGLLNRKEK
jgi:F-type H+-transporting ATPase subunit b